jgi:hypothetical protein
MLKNNNRTVSKAEYRRHCKEERRSNRRCPKPKAIADTRRDCLVPYNGEGEGDDELGSCNDGDGILRWRELVARAVFRRPVGTDCKSAPAEFKR